MYGLSEYYVDEAKNHIKTGGGSREKNGSKETVILLGYANMNEEKIKEAVTLLGEAWKKTRA